MGMGSPASAKDIDEGGNFSSPFLTVEARVDDNEEARKGVTVSMPVIYGAM